MRLIKHLKSLISSNNGRANGNNPTEPALLDDQTAASLSSWPGKNEDLFYQLEDTYYQYLIGVNSLLQVELNPFETSVIESLEQAIEQNQSLADDIPRLSDIIPKLFHLFRSNDFSWKEAARLIAQDPVLLVGVIKVANSPRFNIQIKDELFEDVLVQLGLQEVRKVMMAVALKPILLTEGGHFLKHSGTKIRVHSVNTAEACHTLAKIYEYEPFEAYLAGLLHNIGMVIVVQKMNDIKDFKNVPRSIKFKQELLILSKLLTLKIAENWGMNMNIIQAFKEQLEPDVKNIQSPLGKILFEANAVSMKHILVDEKRWTQNESLNTSSKESPFIQAYEGLSSS